MNSSQLLEICSGGLEMLKTARNAKRTADLFKVVSVIWVIIMLAINVMNIFNIINRQKLA